ncbi:hypothetical protein [Thermoactinospora rubra]|uniref:hypothetical protein n=1 Tax=Thermoactinospora rubra TaxID=1088767 RepID=UPI000A10116D|nr:hypothetical protein [Thermoactinospora rubra]
MRLQTRSGTKRLGHRTYKTMLVLHVFSIATWVGMDLAFGTLVLTAVLTDSRDIAATSLKAIEIFAVWPMFAASVAALLTGAVLALGTKYGLVRYWWVVVKLLINLLMCALILFSLRYGVAEAAEYGRRLEAGTAEQHPMSDLLYPVFVAPTLLMVAVILSVFKPWGRIGGRRSERRPLPR